MVITALLFGAYPFMSTAWAMGLCSVLLGLAPHAMQGPAIARRLMSLNLSSVLMPLLFGTAGVVVGVSVVFWTVGTLVGLGAHAAWKLRPA